MGDEPPITASYAGGEREMLLAFLQRQRDLVVWKLAALSDDGARAVATATGLTVHGVVLHLLDVERSWVRRRFARPGFLHRIYAARMSSLADLLRERTALGEDAVHGLHRLVAQWQLVSDLSFADLVLWVPTRGRRWLAAAHMRPTTGPTAHPQEVVGSLLEPAEAGQLERARREARIVPDVEPVLRPGRVPVHREAVPVVQGNAVVAVLSRDSNLVAARPPGALELAYLTSAGELFQMIAEGTFPYPGDGAAADDPERAPRVGDGLLRLDRTGHVVYASPNAQSAYRRLGVTGDLLGAHLGQTVGRLPAGAGGPGEPGAAAALAAALGFGEPREAEVEAQGTTVLLRVMPLAPGGEPRGALVLLRDVTELRHRDRQILGKDATIREIHHRVKNNLQTVAALLRLQARRLDAPAARAALEESVRRVSSIALVHETLSLTLEEVVSFDAIADRVLAMCAQVALPEGDVQVRREGRFGELAAAVATPLAMVLTELVQNAVEHGFGVRPGAPGEVVVAVRREPGQLLVDVLDDGGGLPAGFELATSTRLGLQIVRTLVETEMLGSIELVARPGRGTRVSLQVPLASSPA